MIHSHWLRGALFLLHGILFFNTSSASAQLVYDSADASRAKQELRVLRITPQGSSVHPRNAQIAIKFNQPMAPIGQQLVNDDQVSLRVVPQLACQWRWMDNSTAVCHLTGEKSLMNATRYRVSIASAYSELTEARLSEPVIHDFSTQRPKITRVRLEDWSTAAFPVINVWFNQPVTKSSLSKALSFRHSNGTQLAGAEVTDEWNPLSEDAYLKFEESEDYQQVPYLSVEQPSSETETELKRRATATNAARQHWRVSPKRALPADTRVMLGLNNSLFGIQGSLSSYGRKSVHGFRTLPEFRYLGLECSSISTDAWITIAPDTPNNGSLRTLNAKGEEVKRLVDACNPQQQVSLKFSTPVSYQSAGAGVAFKPDLAGGDPNYQPWSTRSIDYRARRFFNARFNYDNQGVFELPLPERLKAFERYGLTSTSALVDYFDRPLSTQIDMGFLTSHRKPSLDLFHPHSVFEAQIDSDLAAMVTNLDGLLVEDYQTTTVAGRRGPFTFKKALDDVQDISYRVPVGVRDLLNGASGAVRGTLSSDPAVERYGRRQRPEFFSQVTPFQVHVKFGHFSSMAWVTDLATGLPVADAQVSLELDTYQNLSLADAKSASLTDSRGVAMLPGVSEVDSKLTHVNRYGSKQARWFVKVRKGDDLAFLPLDGYYEAWSDVWPYLRKKEGHMHAWGFTAQGVYKAGDQIDYKIIVRNQSNRHWVSPPDAKYSMSVVDPKGQTIHQVDEVELSEFGSVAGSFSTTPSSAVGWYQFQLRVETQAQTHTLSPMRVLVSDFTPSSFTAENSLNGDAFETGDTLSISSFARMHAGGPYASAEVRVTTNLTAKAFTSDHPAANGFEFAYTGGRSRVLDQQIGMLNEKGEWQHDLTLPNSDAVFGKLIVETAVRDDRGKYIAGSSSAEFIGRDRFIGLKSDSWLQSVARPASIDFIVTDASGKPVADTEIALNFEQQVTRATRVKGAGNAYVTNYTQEWVKISQCEKNSSLTAQSCSFIPAQPGYHRVVATAKDSKGRAINNTLHTWATGRGVVVWRDQNTNSVDIIADKSRYKTGDKAKFLIKNPYPDAQALITVERYGVLQTWQQKLEGSTPVIEVPIDADTYPGFYLSVVVMSPRVAAPIESDALGREVDLGKPAFKMGYLKVDVRDDAKEIDVRIKTNRKTYKPRDTVKLSIKADANSGPRQGMELAVVVIDEAVLSLNSQGKNYYDPYSGFNRLDALGVANYNLLMRLIGRQKFERKGANAGGGGGGSDTDLRNLMKFVAYWNPSVTLPKNGKTKLEFQLPDNLTGWRVLAIAVDKNDRMGLGDVNFKVNKPTELRPVMPNQLNTGDRFTAGFSVLNRTNKTRLVDIELRASGSPLAQPITDLQKLELQPYERKTVRLPITTIAAGELAFYARVKDSKDSDAIEHHLTVSDRYLLETQASYGTTQQPKVIEHVAFPSDIVPNVGGVSVLMSPSVLGNVEGAFSYLRDYPYACWEQRLSKALAASQYQQLKAYLSPEFVWPQSEALPNQTLNQAAQFQAPNGGMTYWVNRDDYVSPYLSAYTAMGFAWLAQNGHEVPVIVEQNLHAYLKNYLRQGQKDASVNVQRNIAAVALAALAQRGAISAEEMARYRAWYAEMNLFAKAHYLEAATSINMDSEELLDQGNQLLNYSVQSGGKFEFQEPVSFSSPSTLSSSTRSNCAVMSAMLKLSQTSEASMAQFGDVPFKLARSITQRRGQKTYWANTQENLYCMNAFVRYAQVYEKTSPDLTVTAEFLAESEEQSPAIELGQSKFVNLRDQPINITSSEVAVEPRLAGKVTLNKQGLGRYYYSVRTQYARPDHLVKPINAGIEIKREYAVQRDGEWRILTPPYSIERGELVRVDLFVSTAGPRNFVVVDDPVPGGLEPVNRDLATTSMVDANQAGAIYPANSHFYQQRGWRRYGAYGYSFYHQELRHDSARFYSDYLPAGHYRLSYTAQAIADGDFAIKPVKAEEMYDPDVYGSGSATMLNVADK